MLGHRQILLRELPLRLTSPSGSFMTPTRKTMRTSSVKKKGRERRKCCPSLRKRRWCSVKDRTNWDWTLLLCAWYRLPRYWSVWSIRTLLTRSPKVWDVTRSYKLLKITKDTANGLQKYFAKDVLYYNQPILL